jgi:MftR C-terminal domain
MIDQFITVDAELIAKRAGMSPDDPKPQTTATALVGLSRLQFHALRKILGGTRTPTQVHQAVSADVERADQLKPA